VAYRFEVQETIPAGVRRIATEEIDAARVDLSGVTQHHTEGVHEARKRLKKLRGLLRLVRPHLGMIYEQENVAFRDAARIISGLRESDALLEALDKLEPPVPTGVLEIAEEQLVRRRERTVGSITELERHVAEVLSTVNRARVETWPPVPEDFVALGPGLRRIYRAAGRQLTLSLEEPSPERLHEWRKRVKNHWYHVRLLAPCWPEVLVERQESLHRLSELLGDDHDFSMLRLCVEASPKDFGGEADVALLVEAIELHRTQLVTEAHVLGQKLFAQKPRRFVRRIEEAWNRWRTTTEAGTTT
jgi:CHAD domain-containing protein